MRPASELPITVCAALAIVAYTQALAAGEATWKSSARPASMPSGACHQRRRAVYSAVLLLPAMAYFLLQKCYRSANHVSGICHVEETLS
jgi:hypothetical protein